MGSDSPLEPVLPAPRTAAGRDGLAALLARPDRAVLALDFDGTLAPIVPDPDQARAHPRAADVLARLAPHSASLAVLTGRPAARAAQLCGLTEPTGEQPPASNLLVLGAYGAERWEAATGVLHAPPVHPGVRAVRSRLPGILADTPGAAEAHIEDKGAAVAVHTRRTAEPDTVLERLREPLTALAQRHDLIIEPGRLVLELRPRGVDKGLALRRLVAEVDAEAVLFAGDDLGDLAAFAAVEELRAAGVPGVLVCSGSAEVTELAGRADLVVDGPAGVIALLAGIAEAVARPR